MKNKNITLFISMALLLSGTAFGAESDNSHPYLGVLLDMTPLPELLTKHLGLSPGQGVRIRNIQKNSPAEESGLERDDIIVRIQDKDVYKYETIVLTVQEASVGEEISLNIIHLGQRKTMKIELEATKGEQDWKYPPEPELEQSILPGQFIVRGPGETDWSPVFPGEIPAELKTIFREIWHYSDALGHKITIEGDPKDENSIITISKGDTKYQTTVKELDKLPEGYREAAEAAVKNAQKRRSEDSFMSLPQPHIDSKSFLPQIYPQKNLLLQQLQQQQLLNHKFEPDNQMLDKITGQINQLMEQMKELEKSQSELLERLSEIKAQERQKTLL